MRQDRAGSPGTGHRQRLQAASNVRLALLLAALAAGPALPGSAWAGVEGGAAAPAAEAAAPTLFGLPVLPREDFNRLAVQNALPLLWSEDRANPGVIDPDELVVLGFSGEAPAYLADGAFLPSFESAYRQLVESRRRELVRRELDQGLPTLVLTDLTGASATDKELVRHIARAAALIDELYLKQKGAAELEAATRTLDPESRALFRRNHGPWCVAAQTESDPFCSALPTLPPRLQDTYPPGETLDASLCARLAAAPNGKELLAPFTVVSRQGDGYVAVPLNEAYEAEMSAIAEELGAAASVLATVPEEAALRRYLLAAAEGFKTNRWTAADEAWAAMNATNSRWYLRIAPDEVYWDICQEKAGFHASFARIDRRSLEWQAKLAPLRGEMEGSLARLIGPPYAAREVAFQMPDFIEIVINAGDARSPLGATIGQSLPNWGPVAEEGRGRTVVMTNLYTDPDSKRVSREKAASLLVPATMAHYSDDQLPGLLDIILHEAAHNLGPYSDYKIDGKGPSEVFGGRLASVLEELKAQTASLYYTELLRKRRIIDDELARQLYTHAMTWCFGHIAQGMFSASGNPKPYSQLAAVQVGTLVEEGALRWERTTDPATGKAVGKFALVYEKVPAAAERLMQKVGRIKATGDAKAGQALIDAFVSGKKKELVHMDEIAERLLRYGKGSLVYSVKL